MRTVASRSGTVNAMPMVIKLVAFFQFSKTVVGKTHLESDRRDHSQLARERP